MERWTSPLHPEVAAAVSSILQDSALDHWTKQERKKDGFHVLYSFVFKRVKFENVSTLRGCNVLEMIVIFLLDLYLMVFKNVYAVSCRECVIFNFRLLLVRRSQLVFLILPVSRTRSAVTLLNLWGFERYFCTWMRKINVYFPWLEWASYALYRVIHTAGVISSNLSLIQFLLWW